MKLQRVAEGMCADEVNAMTWPDEMPGTHPSSGVDQALREARSCDRTAAQTRGPLGSPVSLTPRLPARHGHRRPPVRISAFNTTRTVLGTAMTMILLAVGLTLIA